MSFEVNIRGVNEQTIITLKDLTSNTFVEVYAFGALLNKFVSTVNNTELDVVDGFTSPTEAAEKLTPFFQSAKLSPSVCRVKNAKYTFGGNDYQLTKYSSNGNSLHGLLFDAVFTVTDSYGNNDEACVTLEYTYNNSSEGYPFTYKCAVTYKLTAANTLSVATTITNIDQQLIPVTDGWHPYFTVGDLINNCQLEFQSKEMLEFDDTLIPTGKMIPYNEFNSIKNFGATFYDNCFTLNFAECQPMCVLRNPARKVQLEIHPEESYPYLQIYTPEHRKSIAIENLSAAPDAFNNGIGLKVLQPGESATFTTKFIVRSL